MSDTVKAASSGTPAQLLATPSSAAAATNSAGGGGGTGSAILLQTPPPALSALSAGQIIRAVVVSRTADGKTLVDTRFGQLALELPISPMRGQVLRLQILHSGLPLELTLLSASAGEEEKQKPTEFTQLRAGAQLRGKFTSNTAGANAVPGSARAPGGAAGNAPTALNLRVLSVGTPGKPATAAPQNELLLTGTVTGSTRGGTLVQTTTGTLLLPGVINAPKGAQITLQILATPGTVLPMTAAGAQAQSISALSHGWPALLDAIETVRAADPTRAAAIVAESVPTTGPRLATGLAFFLNAVFGARMQDWLGRDMQRTLETQRRGDLISRLGTDFAEFSRLAGEPVGNDWRAVMLPLMHDDMLHQIRLYLRAHDGNDGTGGTAGDDDAGTRFVVEVDLSRLGALQLDGLVRPNRFDLMVRTHRALPAHVRTEIGDLFAAANEEMKAIGQIGFQVAREFSVAPLETVEGHTVGVFA